MISLGGVQFVSGWALLLLLILPAWWLWQERPSGDRKSTRLNSSHLVISYAVFCLKKKNNSDTQSSNARLTAHHLWVMRDPSALHVEVLSSLPTESNFARLFSRQFRARIESARRSC